MYIIYFIFFNSIICFCDLILKSKEGSLDARKINGSPLKGEIIMYMICELQQALASKKTLDVLEKFANHCEVYFKKVKEEQFNVFLNKVKS